MFILQSPLTSLLAYLSFPYANTNVVLPPSLSPSLAFSWFLFLSLSICPSLSLSFFLSPSLSLSFWLYLSLYFSFSPSLSPSLPFFFSLPLSFTNSTASYSITHIPYLSMRCKYVPNRPKAPSCVHWKNPATLFTHLVLRASDNLTIGQGNTERKRSENVMEVEAEIDIKS